MLLQLVGFLIQRAITDAWHITTKFEAFRLIKEYLPGMLMRVSAWGFAQFTSGADADKMSIVPMFTDDEHITQHAERFAWLALPVVTHMFRRRAARR